ncbi:hypothetical protein [Streptomyces pseudogriseolus]|uniref:hypothetical protein n=1 Tax=Streptomyces pseudogriseolus TaxID=36817 RepID=UPI003FA2786A
MRVLMGAGRVLMGAGRVLMGAGLSGPVVALAWHGVGRERPETAFVVVPLGLLALMTVLFGIDEGFPRC